MFEIDKMISKEILMIIKKYFQKNILLNIRNEDVDIDIDRYIYTYLLRMQKEINIQIFLSLS